MKAFAKLEEKINALLMKIGSIFVMLFKKSTPKNIKNKYSNNKTDFETKKKNFKKYADAKKIQVIEKSKILKEKSIKLKTKAIEKSAKFSNDAKNFKPKEVDWKKKLFIFTAIFLPILKKAQVWMLTLKPITVISGLSVTTVVGLTTISFYSQVEKISSKIDEGRTPDSVGKVEQKKVRATYHKQTEKELKISGLNMPVYLGESKKLKSVVIDFTMVATNRYIPNFFATKPYYLTDQMNSTIHPFIPEITLESEGKTIIKVKIKKELNILLKKLHIKGEIKDVYIHSLLAG